MWPALMTQDHVFVNKSGYQPRRGELIVFEHPHAQSAEGESLNFAKRVVGVPGDTVLLRDEKLFINGEQVKTCELGRHPAADGAYDLHVEFLGEQAYLVAHDSSFEPAPNDSYGPTKLGPGQLFVLGDNRDNSHDSRWWPQGPSVPLQNVKGRVWLIWLSFRDGQRDIDFSRIPQRVHGRPRLPPGASAKLEARLAECLQGWSPPVAYSASRIGAVVAPARYLTQHTPTVRLAAEALG